MLEALHSNGDPRHEGRPTVYALHRGDHALPGNHGRNGGVLALGFQAATTADDGRITLYLGGALPAGATFQWQPGKLYRVDSDQPVRLSIDVGNIIFDHGPAVGVKRWSAADLRQEGDYWYDSRHWQVVLRAAANPASGHRSIELALTRHIIDEGGCGYVTYDNLALCYGGAHGIGGGGTRRITVRDCDIGARGRPRQCHGSRP